jgi:DNA-directed RNA polymerase subunit beta'
MLERFKEYIHAHQFNAIRIGLASPEKIRSWSYGEVKKIETINYRTLKPERDGLFCARIFGPVKDWECNCGKYKRMKHRGVTCEKCGVEVIQARVRRERMGHIELVAPVCHIWFLKNLPSHLGLLMDMSVKEIERVIYYDSYMVVHQGRSPYPRKTVLAPQEYDTYLETHPDDMDFVAEMGAEGVRKVLALFDFAAEIEKLKQEYLKTNSVALRLKVMRRLKVISVLQQSNQRPEWMVFSVLPVLPPDLRPLVPLEGGRFASSDLNELYRRVLNRNIRLQRLMEIEAPSVIVKNEKRMLQESVDALIDNGRRRQPVRGSNRRPLKSLSEMLRGKQGRFRQNLLGKRVDYSGRSVIVVDPELPMDRCGLPKMMAIELFKTHVLAGLIQREMAPNLRVAKRMVEDLVPEVWDVLEEVVQNHPVLLNRAPTLHRLGIQAFYPILVDGKAIKIHPLVCSAYNADFDGDQMAVHVPLSVKATEEAKRLMLSVRNIMSPQNGRPLTVPSQDMILGLHYMTKVRSNVLGENAVFASVAEVVTAYQHGAADLHARIKVRFGAELIDTSVGRMLLYEALPAGSEVAWVNKILGKSDLARMVEQIYHRFGSDKTVVALDKIKHLGFYHSTMAGISFVLTDLIVPEKKDAIIDRTEQEVQKIEQLYMDGVITNGERYHKVISLWAHATDEIANNMTKDLERQDAQAFTNADRSNTPFNLLFMALESRARGAKEQFKQLVGMRGLMAKPSGEIMETPVRSNFKQGLSVFEYFISTHGARKGQADTALKTANSGYLTRRLVDVAQDVVIATHDCKTLGAITLEDLKESSDVIYPLVQRIVGRVLASDLRDAVNGQLLLPKGTLVTRQALENLADAAVMKVAVRSPLVCQAKRGICALCYGTDLSKGELVDVGTTVGIIAAQSIGEPGTQLTMRTFHIGGTASLAEQSSYIAKHAGTVQLNGVRTALNRHGQTIVLSRRGKLLIVAPDGRELQRHDVEYGSLLLVEDGQEVTPNTKLIEWDSNNRVILSEYDGEVKFIDLVDNVTVQQRFDESTNRSQRIILEQRGDRHQPAVAVLDAEGEERGQYYLPVGGYLNVEPGQQIKVGDVIVKMPRETSKTKDITGGLPRIQELFEARMPKDPAIIADIDGSVVFAGFHRGMRKISVVNGDESFDYLVPRGKQLMVNDGDKVAAGDALTSGAPVLHDILRIQGPQVLQKYLVDRIQEIYRLQGVDINDRHIELIVRQMVRKVRVVDPGESEFLVGDRVDSIHFKMVNAALHSEGKRPAAAKPVLMGITLASLDTESFISAASFQETTRILADAAVAGQVDYLYGLKENVIIGKLISAGTGVEQFRDKYLNQPEGSQAV